MTATNDFLGDSAEPILPNWEVGDGTFAFPEGEYYGAIGKLAPQYAKDADPRVSEPTAVSHEIWILKTLGEKGQQRINLKDGVVTMPSIKGVKLIEWYPNPRLKPNQKWKAAAFFGKFDCLSAVPSSTGEQPVKVVDWAKVKQKYGLVFKFSIIYVAAKDGSGKKFRNINNETITPIGTVIPADDMHKIEAIYDTKRAAEKAEQSGDVVTPASLDETDLPF